MITRRLAVLSLVVPLLAAALANAAFLERDVLNELNATAAVLRYLHQEMRYVHEKLELVRNTRELTEKQYRAQAQIVDEQSGMLAAEKARPRTAGSVEKITFHTIKLDVYKTDLAALKRQQEKLAQFRLEKTYSDRLLAMRRVISRYEAQLEARMLEFRVHFGRQPNINRDFKSEVSRFRQKDFGLSFLRI